jgi:predicted site-specific integrase-resolvase
MSDTIKLTQLAAEISKLSTCPSPSYYTLWCMATKTEIPAKRGDNGRWIIKREDLPEIVEIIERRKRR